LCPRNSLTPIIGPIGAGAAALVLAKTVDIVVNYDKYENVSERSLLLEVFIEGAKGAALGAIAQGLGTVLKAPPLPGADIPRAVANLGPAIASAGATINQFAPRARNVATKLIGVPETPLNRVISRLEGLRVGDRRVVESVEAFGSRAGSVFRGRGPLEGSDLDLLVTIDKAQLGGRNAPWIRSTLQKIATDFYNEAGFELSIHAPENVTRFRAGLEGPTVNILGR
jgi:predicted nucleotidyltransferase